jgi:hypothetical protein
VAPAVSLALSLPIALDGGRVGLPVLAGIFGIQSAPFLLAVTADLVVLGVCVELTAVVIPAALPLAIRPTANELVGMITGKLKQLLAVATWTIAHQAAPNRDSDHSL